MGPGPGFAVEIIVKSWFFLYINAEILSQTVTRTSNYTASHTATPGSPNFAYLTFMDLVRQRSMGNFAQECPCVMLPGSNRCISYDSRYQAATIEEAILTFIDTSMDSRIYDQWAGGTISPTSLTCTTEECRQCASLLAVRLQEVGFLQQSLQFPFVLPVPNPSACQRLRISRSVPTYASPLTTPTYIAQTIQAGLAYRTRNSPSVPQTPLNQAIDQELADERAHRGRPIAEVFVFRQGQRQQQQSTVVPISGGPTSPQQQQQNNQGQMVPIPSGGGPNNNNQQQQQIGPIVGPPIPPGSPPNQQQQGGSMSIPAISGGGGGSMRQSNTSPGTIIGSGISVPSFPSSSGSSGGASNQNSFNNNNNNFWQQQNSQTSSQGNNQSNMQSQNAAQAQTQNFGTQNNQPASQNQGNQFGQGGSFNNGNFGQLNQGQTSSSNGFGQSNQLGFNLFNGANQGGFQGQAGQGAFNQMGQGFSPAGQGFNSFQGQFGQDGFGQTGGQGSFGQGGFNGMGNGLSSAMNMGPQFGLGFGNSIGNAFGGLLGNNLGTGIGGNGFGGNMGNGNFGGGLFGGGLGTGMNGRGGMTTNQPSSGPGSGGGLPSLGGFGGLPFGRKKRQIATRETNILGQRFIINCVERGAAENEETFFLNLCTACWAWRQLPPDHFPRLINELVCKEGDFCLSGWGSCQQKYRNVDVLRRVGNDWTPTTVQGD